MDQEKDRVIAQLVQQVSDLLAENRALRVQASNCKEPVAEESGSLFHIDLDKAALAQYLRARPNFRSMSVTDLVDAVQKLTLEKRERCREFVLYLLKRPKATV